MGKVKRQRDSRVEVLRIIAMALIVLNHTMQINMIPGGGEAGIILPFVSNLLSRLGALGDVIFFSITTHYLWRSKSTSIKYCLRKAWILERELLFYSVTLFISFSMIKISGIGMRSYGTSEFLDVGFRSMFPVIEGLWWYASSYSVFLITLPALNYFLEAIGRKAHFYLSFSCLIIFGFPRAFGLADLGWSVPLFIYQYIVLTSIMDIAPMLGNHAWHFMFLASFALMLIDPFAYAVTGNDYSWYINSPQCILPMVCGSSSLVCSLRRQPTHESVFVNAIASHMLGVYLIMCYPLTTHLISLIVRNLAVRAGSNDAMLLMYELAVSFAVFILCVAIDCVRSGLFAVLFDRNKARLFEKVWNGAVSFIR